MSVPPQPSKEVMMISLKSSMAVLDNGIKVPVTNWIDSDGDDCEPKDALLCVAGSEIEGWFTVELSRYKPMRFH